MKLIPQDPPRLNRLLDALWPTEGKGWLSQLQSVEMPVGKLLFGSGDVLRYLYFPTTAVVSLLTVLENGDTAETAVVGCDGIVGISLFMGGETALTSASVRIGGRGFRIAASVLMAEFHRCGIVQQRLLRYTQALIAQMSQTAVCNRHHTLDEQLCRCLLLTRDRLRSDVVAMTHDQMANCLGVRRESVSMAAADLEHAGLIRRHRGRVMLIDRPGLELRVCECYAVVKARYDSLEDAQDDLDACALRA